MQKTIAYSVYLAMEDSGASASGWITSPIVRGLGIQTPDQFSGIADLVVICAVSQVGVLVLLPLVKNWQDRTQPQKARGRGE